ncbi:MAG TPA: Gfo/Idh/MocA family oxidoreductase [Anaerolineae bacterium]|nr:Gfo/Idh/MocA family oxidoreductase [Anaerolineae bacterium]
MTSRRFNWGIIGPGRIAHQFAQGLHVIDDAALYAVASTTPGKAQDFAAQYGGAKTYPSYEALVDDPQVDAIYIATPHRFHIDNALLCLKAGKPVLCEKPLTVNAAETRQLIETARANKVFLMEALWTRYLPIYQQVRQWLDAKVIGDLRLLVSNFGINVPKDEGDRWLNPELAGGTLLDMGVYPIAVSQWIMGRQPQAFSAQAHMSNTGVDELTAVLLKYENGVISQFDSNFITDGVNDFMIYGSIGHIRIHGNYWGATQATLVTADQSATVSRPFRGGGFEYQTEEAMRCIRAGLLESPGMTHADTLANMQLMDGIRAEIGLRYPFEK